MSEGAEPFVARVSERPERGVPVAQRAARAVLPPSPRGETVFFLRLAFHVAFWAAFVMLARAGGGAAPAQQAPFETRFSDLDAADQRLFRALQEGMIEAEADRGRSGQWPSPDQLSARAIPPFAPDPIDRAAYTWRILRGKTLLNYVGSPLAASGRRAFVVIVTEPEPGTASDPNAIVDEFHHRLSDGTMIHVSIWMGPGLPEGGEAVPFVSPDDGWRRVIVSSGSFSAAEP